MGCILLLPFLLFLEKAYSKGPAKTALINGKTSERSSVKAWKLTQSSNLIGPLKCVVSDKGVRLNAEKIGLLWIFKAPQWDAYLYNQETKHFCSFKYAQWTKRGFFTPGASRAGRHSLSPLKKTVVKKTGKKLNIANLQTEQVEFVYPNGIKYGEFWVAKQIVVPNQFKEVVAKMLRLPMQEGGTPLKAIIRNKYGKLVPVLETQGAQQIEVDSSLFEPLVGYERVKDEMALLFTGSDMFGSTDTMFGESTAKQKNPSRTKAKTR